MNITLPTWDVGAIDELYRRDHGAFLRNSAGQIVAEANAGRPGYGPGRSTAIMGRFWTGHDDVVIQRTGPRGGVRVQVVSANYVSPVMRVRAGSEEALKSALEEANRLHRQPNVDLPGKACYRRNGLWWERGPRGVDQVIRDAVKCAVRNVECARGEVVELSQETSNQQQGVAV